MNRNRGEMVQKVKELERRGKNNEGVGDGNTGSKIPGFRNRHDTLKEIRQVSI